MITEPSSAGNPPAPLRSGFLERLIGFSVDQWAFVVVAALALAIAGSWAFLHLPIDAVPDITNVQVQINAEADGFTPEEIEQQVTLRLETAIAGTPHLVHTRSLSRYGLGQVTAVFEDGTDIYFARQQLGERLQEVRGQLPEGVDVAMGPITTGLGDVFFFTVEPDTTAAHPVTDPGELRTIHDYLIKPRLRSLPGVAEVNPTGGDERIWQVAPDPARMAARGVSFGALIEALEANNASTGAGYLERSGEQVLVRSPGQLSRPEEVRGIPVLHSEEGVVRVSDVAEVLPAAKLRTGAATARGRDVVLGTVVMLKGANSREVARAAAERLREIESSLPAGVKVAAVYDRTDLVERTIATVRKNLLEGALLVIAVLFVLLGNIRAAVLTALVIPLSMLATLAGMQRLGISANLMSLGALDFGIIVDGTVILVENYMRRLHLAQRDLGRRLDLAERRRLVVESSSEVRRSTLAGVFIIGIVYIPIFALEGVEGRMFHPMAWAVVLALAAALALSLTVVPALLPLWVKKASEEGEGPILGRIGAAYMPSLRFSLRHPAVTGLAALTLVAACALLSTRMGAEFIPGLDEGDIAIQPMRIPGTGIDQSSRMQQAVERRILEFPEVANVFSRIGTPDVATDPMPPNIADAFVMLKPRAQWPDPDLPKDELVDRLADSLAGLPGNAYEFTQPIEMRFNELISGVRSDVAFKVFGDDLAEIERVARRAAALLQTVSGATDVKVEQVSGLPLLSAVPDREALARHGITLGEAQKVLQAAVGGIEAGALREGDRVFPVVVRLSESQRQDPSEVSRLNVPDPHGGDGAFVPLGRLLRLSTAEGPAQISREEGKRRIVVSLNVRGRDISSFVAEARERIEAERIVPAGMWATWGGTFEQLQSASRRLALLLPLALLVILAILFVSLGSLKDSLIVFTGIPLALTGGVLSLLLRGMPLSISAGIGFIALSGIAVLNGLVLVSFIRGLRQTGRGIFDAVAEGARGRLRPVLMTALVAALGFVPMALSHGAGAEVQRPLATVVIGGILTSTALTLLVLPSLYAWFHRGEGGQMSPG